MSSLPPIDIIKSLSESLFHIGEKKRLKELKKHNAEREATVHTDLISKVHGNDTTSEHIHSMEHHGLEFWTYYYPGERPNAVLKNKPVANHMYGTEQQHLAIEKHMLEPEFAAFDKSSIGSETLEALSKKRWTGLLLVAETALAKELFSEAESSFRLALEETKNFKASEAALSRTMSGLAKSLCKQDKHAEAEELYMKVFELDEHIVGYGNTNMEEEFYAIARHLIEQSRHEDVIEVFWDLIERLNKSVGRRSPMVARCLNELGVVYCKQRKFDMAERVLARAVEILSKFSSGSKEQLAITMQNLAKALDAIGEHDDAEKLLQEAIEIMGQE